MQLALLPASRRCGTVKPAPASITMTGRPVRIGIVPDHFHALPFQCSTRGLALEAPKSLVQPTAQALRPEMAKTPRSWPPFGGAGMRTRFQVVPFQCSASGVSVLEVPTAQALVADEADTPLSAAAFASAGLRTRFQAEPFQCAIRAPSEPE